MINQIGESFLDVVWDLAHFLYEVTCPLSKKIKKKKNNNRRNYQFKKIKWHCNLNPGKKKKHTKLGKLYLELWINFLLQLSHLRYGIIHTGIQNWFLHHKKSDKLNLRNFHTGYNWIHAVQAYLFWGAIHWLLCLRCFTGFGIAIKFLHSAENISSFIIQ